VPFVAGAHRKGGCISCWGKCVEPKDYGSALKWMPVPLDGRVCLHLVTGTCAHVLLCSVIALARAHADVLMALSLG